MCAPSNNSDAEPTQATSRAWLWSTLTALAILTLLGVGTWASYVVPHRTDQYQLILLGDVVYHGGRLYVDAWENKPPGLAWLNALAIALGGGRQIVAWIMPGVIGLTALVIWWRWAGRALSPISARLGVLLAAGVVSLRMYDTPSINPDFYSAMFELIALALLLGAVQGPRRMWPAIGAGLAAAVAVGMKQTGAIGLLSVTFVALLVGLGRRDVRRDWWPVLGWAWAGVLAVGGLVVGVLAWRGTLAEAQHAILGFNRGLLTAQHLADALVSAWRHRIAFDPLHLPLWLAGVGLIVTLRTGRAGRVQRLFVVACVLWGAGQAWLALAGPSQSARYWQATWPALLFLMVTGIWHLEQLFRRVPPLQRWPAGLLCITVAGLLGVTLADHYRYGLPSAYLAATRQPTQRDELRSLGAVLADVVPPGESIYVWAYRPGIYLFAGRPPASRFTYPRSADQLAEIMATLEADPPAALLVPTRTAAAFELWCDTTCHDRLAALLTHYTEPSTYQDLQIYLRKPTPAEGQ